MQETENLTTTLNTLIRKLNPEGVWNHFSDLNSVPRASKKEERVIKFMQDFGKKPGLSVLTDDVGNVIIKKPASPGMENRKPVVLQSHLDMVHQKNADSNFDFDNSGIEMFIDGDWVKAKGTTLGADNGIGVASIMTILASDNIAHPPLEALFTIDEETGMTGAKGLKGGLLNGMILLNLDTEEDHELTIGCAGGIDVTIKGKYERVSTPAGSSSYNIYLKGLTGGHSGTEIHLGRGNANKLMNRFLLEASEEYNLRLSSLEGGSLRNAIPREAAATVVISSDKKSAFENHISAFEKLIRLEYRTTDPSLKILYENTETPEQVMNQKNQLQLLRSIYACPNGIYRMSPDIQGLVQTSNNVARVQIKEGGYSIQCLTRGSVDSEKMDEARAIRSVFEMNGAEVTYSGEYPGWKANPETSVLKLMRGVYKDLFNAEAHVNAVHAGLECGIIGQNYPEMEMISFGPNIYGAHSPDERVQISSVQKFWKYLLETLKNIPVNNS